MYYGQLDTKPECTKCGRTIDGFAGDGLPEAGDLAICYYCGELMEYTDTFDVVKADEKLLEEVDPVVVFRMKIIRETFDGNTKI